MSTSCTRYLSTESYWATHRTRSETEAALAASWCFTLVDESTGAAVGFARLVTDRVTYGWLADVFVVSSMQGRGLGIFLVSCVADAAKGINRLQLGTRDAHGLYAKFGFTPHSYPERCDGAPAPPPRPTRLTWGSTELIEFGDAPASLFSIRSPEPRRAGFGVTPPRYADPVNEPARLTVVDDVAHADPDALAVVGGRLLKREEREADLAQRARARGDPTVGRGHARGAPKTPIPTASASNATSIG